MRTDIYGRASDKTWPTSSASTFSVVYGAAEQACNKPVSAAPFNP